MSTPAVRNNNPGNIKDPSTGQFRQFATPQEGYAALLNDLETKKSGKSVTGLKPSSTLVDFAKAYAPSTDNNNPAQYAASLANHMGVRPDATLQELDTGKWAAAVAHNEDVSSPFGSQPKSQNVSLPGGPEVASAATGNEEQKPETYGASFPATGQESTLEGGAKAVGNLPSSFLNLGKGLLNAGLHPIKTIEGVGSALAGGASELGRAMGTGANVGKPRTKEEETFDALKKVFTDRYGSLEAAQKTAVNDPAGFGADVLTILEGGALAFDKLAGTTGSRLAERTAQESATNFPKTGLNVMPKEGPGTVSGLLNKGLQGVATPVANAVKTTAAAPFKLAAQTMGLQTGVGYNPIAEGFNAAAKGGDANKAFLEGLRGNATPEQLVEQAHNALDEVVAQRRATYKKMLSTLEKDKTTYDISPIYNEVDKQLDKFGVVKTKNGLDFSRSKFALDPTAQKDIENLYNYVKGYGAKAGDRTALGVDNLKQVLGGYYSPNSDYRAFVQGVKGSTRDVLDNAPGYSKEMKTYSDMTDQIKEIKQSLSLGDNAAAETTFRKLTNALKNSDFRKQVIQQLDEATGGQLLPKIAGQRLSEWKPRGLAGAFEGGLTSATAVFAHQAFLPLLALMVTTSPRVVGEFIHALGIGKRGTDAIMRVLNKTATPGLVGAASASRNLTPGLLNTPQGSPQPTENTGMLR